MYAIANGAIGNDAAIVADKIAAATYFTVNSYQASAGTTVPLVETFLHLAQGSVTNVVDAASLELSEQTTNAYLDYGQTGQIYVELVGQADHVSS